MRCLLFFAAAFLALTSCSTRSLDRSSAADLILRHEQLHDEQCEVSFLTDGAALTKERASQAHPEFARYIKGNDTGVSLSDLRAKIGTQLGLSMCSYTVEVSGISLTSGSTRDAVFTGKKIFDAAKLSALSAYVGALFTRLSSLPVQAVPMEFGPGPLADPLDIYELAVIDPSDGRKYLLNVGRMSESEAQRRAKITKLTIDYVWENLPLGLAQHSETFCLHTLVCKGRQGTTPTQSHGVARLQLFDDGWRVLDVQFSERN